MTARSKVKDFADLMQRASGYNGEPLAQNLIATRMMSLSKTLAVEDYNRHIEEDERDGKLLDVARAACLLMGRPDLKHKIYQLLLTPPEPE